MPPTPVPTAGPTWATGPAGSNMAGLRERGQCPWTAAIPWDPAWLCFSPKGATGHPRASCDRCQPRTPGHSPSPFSRFVALKTDSGNPRSRNQDARRGKLRPCLPPADVICLLSRWRGTFVQVSPWRMTAQRTVTCVVAACGVFCFPLGGVGPAGACVPSLSCPPPPPHAESTSLCLHCLGWQLSPGVSQASKVTEPHSCGLGFREPSPLRSLCG